jgi:hypothetical protein
MGWDSGAPGGGWVDPKEAKAAAEAAEKIERARAEADARAIAQADAVVHGFRMLACAVMAAADHPPSHLLERYNTLYDGTTGGLDNVYTGPLEGKTFGAGAFASADFAQPNRPAPDPDLDDLLTDEDEPATMPACPHFVSNYNGSMCLGCGRPPGEHQRPTK